MNELQLSPSTPFSTWIQDLLHRLGLVEDRQPQTRMSDILRTVDPVHKRVSLIIHNPAIPSAGGQKLSQVLAWNNPDRLCADFIDDLLEISYGYANYDIVERIEVDKFPVKADGFVYRADEFVQLFRQRGPFHQPDGVDYHALLAEFNMIAKVDSGHIDEFWLFAFPYAGYYESIMAGPGAFWCNAPPLAWTASASRRFVIMGFNYERGVGEMLESFGHRTESIMEQVFRHIHGRDNLWKRFIRHEHSHPGRAEVGNMHFAPNSRRDYDWGNRRRVRTRCSTWHNFPDLDGEAQKVDCRAWGHGDMREHHKWWFRHLPHVSGSSAGVAYNWWQYILDPNLV
ncbi:MAG: hypothetical protein JSV68_19070 [Anaerolineaceae bacterium]|nr:MAG: hypothetical protein JSV68_19070 [Anaerolineaceae bacterium]